MSTDKRAPLRTFADLIMDLVVALDGNRWPSSKPEYLLINKTLWDEAQATAPIAPFPYSGPAGDTIMGHRFYLSKNVLGVVPVYSLSEMERRKCWEDSQKQEG